MALQIRSGKKTKFINKLITIPVLMLALVAQPMYGMVASQVANAAEAPEVPNLTISPATCENPQNTATYIGDRDDVRLLVNGTNIRIEAEKIPAGEFDIMAALTAYNVPVQYGAVDGDIVRYDRTNTKTDVKIGEWSGALVNPSGLACAPSSISLSVDGKPVESGHVTRSQSAMLHWPSTPNTERYEVAIKRPNAAGFETHYASSTPRKLLVDRDYFGNIDGFYEYKVRAKNAISGVYSEWTSIVSLGYDSTAPEVVNIKQTYETKEGGRIAVELTFNEPVVGSTIGQGWSVVAGSGDTKFVKRYYKTQDYTVTFADRVGNIGSYSFTVDKTNPTLTVEGSAESGRIFGKGRVGISASDANLSTVVIEQKRENGEFTKRHTYTKGTNFSSTANIEWLKGGVYRIQAFDVAGNNSEVIEFTIDVAKPVITGFDFQGLTNNKYNPTKVTARFEDRETFVTSVSIDTYKKVNGKWVYTYSPFVQGTPLGSERNFVEFDSTNPRINTDGTYKFVAWSVDKAGNVSDEAESGEIVVDNTAPKAILSIDKPFNPTKLTIAIEDTNPQGSYATNAYNEQKKAIVLNTCDGRFAAGETSATCDISNLPDGVYWLKANVVDAAGNNSAAVASNIGWQKFTVDNTAPTVTITSPTIASVHSGSVVVSGKATDENGILNDEVTVSFRGPLGSTSASCGSAGAFFGTVTVPVDADGNWTTTVDISGFENGHYCITAQASDNAGNVVAQSGTHLEYFTVNNVTEEPEVPPSEIWILDYKSNDDGTYTILGSTSHSTDTVRLWRVIDGDYVEIENVVVDADGNWSAVVNEPLVPGTTYVFFATTTNTQGAETSVKSLYEFTVAPQNNNNGGGQPNTADAETPAQPEEPEDPIIPLFLPVTFGGLGLNDGTTTPLPATPTTETDDDTDILGAQDTRTSWSAVNAALAGFIAILALVALAGIRRKETDNNTGARLFMIVPAAAAVIAFFVIEDIGGSMGWFNVWTWLFAGILVVQAILATLTTRTAND